MKTITIQVQVPDDFETLDREQQAYLIANDGAWEQISGDPLGWMYQGSSSVYRGEFAEHSAKEDARLIGGTCYAYPVFASPKYRVLSDEEITDTEISQAKEIENLIVRNANLARELAAAQADVKRLDHLSSWAKCSSLNIDGNHSWNFLFGQGWKTGATFREAVDNAMQGETK